MSLQVLLGFCIIAVVAAVPFGPPEEHYPPQPYQFGYDIKDKEGSQHRHESGDGHGNVKGSYGYVDNKGIHREVHYVADKNGFRAQVKTNEPGTSNEDPADVKVDSQAAPQQYEPQPRPHPEPPQHYHKYY